MDRADQAARFQTIRDRLGDPSLPWVTPGLRPDPVVASRLQSWGRCLLSARARLSPPPTALRSRGFPGGGCAGLVADPPRGRGSVDRPSRPDFRLFGHRRTRCRAAHDRGGVRTGASGFSNSMRRSDRPRRPGAGSAVYGQLEERRAEGRRRSRRACGLASGERRRACGTRGGAHHRPFAWRGEGGKILLDGTRRVPRGNRDRAWRPSSLERHALTRSTPPWLRTGSSSKT